MITEEDRLKFGSIIFEIVGSYAMYEPRYDIEFTERQYYVYGICYLNFIPPDKYEKSKYYDYFSTLKKEEPDMFSIYNNLSKDDLTLDVLETLNEQLKAAGAKHVWLHHSKEYNKKLNCGTYVSTRYGEMLLVVDTNEDDVFGEMKMIKSNDQEQIDIFSTKYTGPDAFSGIICNYFHGRHCYCERTNIFTDKTYYVTGINAPNFIHPKNYDATKDRENFEFFKKNFPEMAEEYPGLIAVMVVRHYPTLDHFIEVGRYLKRAGAKQIWISPAEKYDEKTGLVVDDSFGEIGNMLITIEY